MVTAEAHDVVVVGAGNGGLSAAALLRRRGCRDVALVEPSAVHVYKPLQNYVGCGVARLSELTRSQAELIPKGVRWYRTSAVQVDGATGTVRCADGTILTGGDVLLAPGAVVDWGGLPGAVEGLRTGRVCTTFVDTELRRTARMIDTLRRGRAVFTVRSQPASGRETAFKPLFLACDSWRRAGVLDAIEVVLAHEDARLHPVAAIAREIARHLDRFGVTVRLGTSVSAVEQGDTVLLDGISGPERLPADLIHLLPPYAAPALVADSGLDALGTGGFLAVDPETLRHRHYERIWGVGDACDLGDARTGGALRHRVKVAVDNIQRSRRSLRLSRYDGYTVAPIATGHGRLSFGEYDRQLRVRRSLPVPDQIRSRRIWWWLDRYGLPQAYWHRILKGRL
ncbi:MAG: NAD(P)/FAD-dependent oxidoreductase [Microlunatus sp.]|nr:NAD(P)/FAD-dependent oxidoreductase [Microlunatus sp.]MDN5769649.1 NAD(P)/FAD-dependent oxidoreductase [Microlunatus sp.]